jgi:hypothetical protein
MRRRETDAQIAYAHEVVVGLTDLYYFNLDRPDLAAEQDRASTRTRLGAGADGPPRSGWSSIPRRRHGEGTVPTR